MEKEIFKKIDGYEDYMISNFGNILSLKNGDKKILKPFLESKNRYYMITLCRNGQKKKFLVHRLVAKYFCENKENKKVVNHIDHNTHNNYYENLEWVSTQENIHHSYSVMGPVRNTRKCKLIYPNGKEFIFTSYQELLKHKEKYELDFSSAGLNNNGHSRGYKLEKL